MHPNTVIHVSGLRYTHGLNIKEEREREREREREIEREKERGGGGGKRSGGALHSRLAYPDIVVGNRLFVLFRFV